MQYGLAFDEQRADCGCRDHEGTKDTKTHEEERKNRPPLWRCPQCRRAFANRNQSHASGRHALGDHFRGKPPEIRALFDAVVAALRSIGPVRILPEKTRIAFQVRMSFAQVSPLPRHSTGLACRFMESSTESTSSRSRPISSCRRGAFTLQRREETRMLFMVAVPR